MNVEEKSQATETPDLAGEVKRLKEELASRRATITRQSVEIRKLETRAFKAETRLDATLYAMVLMQGMLREIQEKKDEEFRFKFDEESKTWAQEVSLGS